jgi:RHS repeat-associated protein
MATQKQVICRALDQADAGGTVVSFTHNARRQRVAKETPTGTSRFRYDHKNLLQTADGADDLTNAYTATDDEYGDLLSEHDFTDQGVGAGEFYHQFDGQHAANALVDQAGAVVQQMRFSAFGLPATGSEGAAVGGWVNLTPDGWAGLGAAGWAALPVNGWSVTAGTRFAWGGQKQYYLDGELGLYMLGMGAGGRPYDPAVGKFVAEDPLRHAAGDANLSRYVQNNPAQMIDPGGKQATPQDLVAHTNRLIEKAQQDRASWLASQHEVAALDAPAGSAEARRGAFRLVGGGEPAPDQKWTRASSYWIPTCWKTKHRRRCSWAYYS